MGKQDMSQGDVKWLKSLELANIRQAHRRRQILSGKQNKKNF